MTITQGDSRSTKLRSDCSDSILLRRGPLRLNHCDDVALGERDFGTTALDDAFDINDNITRTDSLGLK